ncbi:hypothetical protein [Bacillus sp. SRB1LM]|nr:hypothetical protein [Bacillus sp. SRB1LM]
MTLEIFEGTLEQYADPLKFAYYAVNLANIEKEPYIDGLFFFKH